MSLREAAQRALEALELAQTDVHWELNSPTRKFLRKAEKALRAALAEPTCKEGLQVEPVAWMDIDSDGQRLTVRMWSDGNHEEVPLYTAPPQMTPLTEEEIAEALAGVLGLPHEIKVELARAVERAHGIGGSND